MIARAARATSAPDCWCCDSIGFRLRQIATARRGHEAGTDDCAVDTASGSRAARRRLLAIAPTAQSRSSCSAGGAARQHASCRHGARPLSRVVDRARASEAADSLRTRARRVPRLFPPTSTSRRRSSRRRGTPPHYLRAACACCENRGCAWPSSAATMVRIARLAHAV